jgi:hypothetical protein
MAREFTESWNAVQLRLSDLCSLSELTELEGIAFEIVQHWVREYSLSVSAELQALIDSATGLLGGISQGLQNEKSRAVAMEVFSGIQEIGEFLTGTISSQRTAGSLEFWAGWASELMAKSDIVKSVSATWLHLVMVENGAPTS